jgi:hypothetical protein
VPTGAAGAAFSRQGEPRAGQRRGGWRGSACACSGPSSSASLRSATARRLPRARRDEAPQRRSGGGAGSNRRQRGGITSKGRRRGAEQGVCCAVHQGVHVACEGSCMRSNKCMRGMLLDRVPGSKHAHMDVSCMHECMRACMVEHLHAWQPNLHAWLWRWACFACTKAANPHMLAPL